MREALDVAGVAARRAADALLNFPLPGDDTVGAYFQTLKDYCLRCHDPFQALDVARLLRALGTDLHLDRYRWAPVTDLAQGEARLQALLSRTCRNLRDQGEAEAEEALAALANLHLKALEEGPRYLEVLRELASIVDRRSAVRSAPPLADPFGVTEGPNDLPTEPPRA